jgi:hypothetical protein
LCFDILYHVRSVLYLAEKHNQRLSDLVATVTGEVGKRCSVAWDFRGRLSVVKDELL